MLRRVLPWLLTLTLMASLTIVTTRQALERYREFATGWSWDLAYYNQWFWALTRGDGTITVRPIASYANEGPSVWKMNYLAPIRFAIVPFYRIWPDPRTLLIAQNVVFWWCVPAAFGLVRNESGSILAALSAVALVPLTPLLWPLVWNDFRELQMALPFVLWAIDGIRGRSLWLSALGVGGMLACRQEYALVVASFAILPPREPDEIGRSLRWARTLLRVGLGWFLFAFFGFLEVMVGSKAPEQYLAQFEGPKAGLVETLETAGDFLAIGLGSWTLLACLAPRAAILALPWIWSVANGRWALRLVGTTEWHHVRYTAPMVALTLAAGLIGYAGLSRHLGEKSPNLRLLVLIALAFGLIQGDWTLQSRMRQIPSPVPDASEAASLWERIGEVAPSDGVLAVYELTAPLSSRRELYSYILDINKPPGFPDLKPSIRWAFVKAADFPPEIFTDQGFTMVHSGTTYRVFRRL